MKSPVIVLVAQDPICAKMFSCLPQFFRYLHKLFSCLSELFTQGEHERNKWITWDRNKGHRWKGLVWSERWFLCVWVSGHAAVTACTYVKLWPITAQPWPNETNHRPVTQKHPTIQWHGVVAWEPRPRGKDGFPSMTESVWPEGGNMRPSLFPSCLWFAYTNETGFNWLELIFFPALIELQLSLKFFEWRTDWFVVKFQFI